MPVRRGHRKKKVPWVPTTIVSGLGSDTNQFPFLHLFDPLEEELETISENDEGTSSTDESAASMASMDEEEASLELDPKSTHPDQLLTSISGEPQPSILQLEATQVFPNLQSLDLGQGASSSSAMNPNPEVNISLNEVNSSPNPNFPSIGVESLPPDPEIGLNPAPPPISNFKGNWSQLFADNRKPIEDFMLKKVHFAPTDGCLDFSDESLASNLLFEAPFCLIGYFFGNFPGVEALRQLCDSWYPGITFNLHNSGWILFRFPSEAQLLAVLHKGPIVVRGQILIIRRMPPFFNFAKEGRSLMPIWVVLPNIPLQLMRRECLEVIGSQIGTPIMTDKLTHTLERVSFARMLVEVDLSQPMISDIVIKLPGNIIHTQLIKYEKRPLFCSQCWSIGHDASKCNKMQSPFPSTTTQHAWNPKPHRKKSVWQRVPVDKQKAPVSLPANESKDPTSLPRNSSNVSPERLTSSIAHESAEPVLTTALIEEIPNASVQ
ncbi:hypothetical protein Dimus_013056, partial [Dionaea muscipula]